MNEPICMTLPYPLSANRYWRSFVPKGHKRAVTIVSEEARAYRQEVGWRCKAAGVRQPFQHRVSVHLQLFPERPQDWERRARRNPDCWDDDVRCVDLDNARKVLYDAFKGVVVVDDKWIWQDSAIRMEPDEQGARVVVTITPLIIQRPQSELFA